MNQNPNMNYTTMSGQEFIQRYPQGLQRFEKPLLEAGQIGGGVARELGRFIPGVGAALTAADIYDGLNSPVQAGTLQPTDTGYRQASYQDLLPLIQLNNQGQPDYMLQGGVEENYMLPPKSNNNMEDYYKKFKQFYGLMKANPQVPFNVFNNFIQGDTKDLPGLLNGSSAGFNA